MRIFLVLRASRGSRRGIAAPATASTKPPCLMPAGWWSATDSSTAPERTSRPRRRRRPGFKIDDAATRTAPILDAPPGIVELIE